MGAIITLGVLVFALGAVIARAKKLLYAGVSAYVFYVLSVGPTQYSQELSAAVRNAVPQVGQTVVTVESTVRAQMGNIGL